MSFHTITFSGDLSTWDMVLLCISMGLVKKLEYFNEFPSLAMLLKFLTFLHCKTGHLKGGNMTNIGLGHNFGNNNTILL